MQKNNTFTFKSITNNEMNVYENEKSYIEKHTNISKNILSKLRSIAIANKLAIILRPVNPAAFALIKRNAVGKNMFVHGKSAEEGLAKGLIPLRSSISKAGKTNDIQNIQKYNSENEHSINNSCNVFEDIKSKHKLGERISEDKFEELVFSVKLLDKENRQIFIFENKDNLALKDNSNKHVYAIKDSGTFRLIDENHELVDENHKKIDNDVDKAEAAQWLKDKIAKEYSNEREVEVFGKPKIKEEDGTLKIKEVQPITADIDVLAYGYSIQTSGRKYSDVGNFQTLLEDGRRKIIKDSGVSLSYEEEKNLINKGIQDIGNLHLPDDMISKFKDLEFSSVYLSGMGDGTEITHAITGSMRATFPNIEISHGPEQFNLRFPQPLDKEWICISYKQQSDNINEESKAVDGIAILHNEQELVDAFNNFRQDGLNMLPNPHWAWKLENGKYVIDHKYKEMFNKIDELAFDANKNVSQSQKEDIENILKIKVDFGIELATQNKALSKREQILQKVMNSSTDVIQFPQSSKDELRMWTNINEDYKKVLYYLSDNIYGRNVNVKDKYGKTALHYAVEAKNLGLVQSLIKDKAKVNSLDKDGRTALHRAAQLGDVNIVEYLIKNGANIDEKDKYNRAIIHHSVRYGALTKRLIEDYQVDVNVKDKYDKTALHYAVEAKNLGVVQLLVENKAKIDYPDNDGKTALHRAAQLGDVNIVEYLIKNGANIDEKDNNGKTALHRAAQLGDVNIVEYLIKNGANIDEKDKYNRAIIHHSVRHGELTKKLIEDYQVDVNVKDKYDKTALHRAAQLGDVNIVEYLIKNGANIDEKDNNGKTALHYAVEAKNLGVVQLLVKNEAKIDYPDKHDNTALHRAIELDYVNIVEYLIKNGANIDKKDNDGKTALHRAIELDNVYMVKCLIKNGANIDKKDNDDKTALYYAVEAKNLGVVQLLVENKAKIDYPDKDGKTALNRARELCNVYMVKCLKKAEENNLGVVQEGKAKIDYPDKDGRTALNRAQKLDKRKGYFTIK